LTHYAIGAWVDHVRGLGTATKRLRMRAHLSRCARCARMARWLTEMGAVVRADAATVVPDTVVTRAVALFTALDDPARHDEAPRG
jgi:anti-sigma factor RsiW